MRPHYIVVATTRGAQAHEQWGREIEARLNAVTRMGGRIQWAVEEAGKFTAIMEVMVPIELPSMEEIEKVMSEAKAEVEA